MSDDSRPAERLSEPRWLSAALLLVAVAIPIAVYAFFVSVRELRLDETVHVAQLDIFLDEGLRAHPRLTMLPGLHLLVAGLERLSGVRELWAVRLTGMIGGLVLVFAAALAARTLTPSRTGWRSAQVAALPLVAPLYALFYTDVVGVALLVAACVALLSRRVALAALLMFLMLAVRHSLVGFAVWMSALSVLSRYEDTARSGAPAEDRRMAVARSHGVLALPLIAFGIAAWQMGGPTLGDAEFHPLSFHLANVPFSIVLLGGLLAPSHLRAAPRVWALLRRRPGPSLLCALGFASIAALTSADHPFNVASIDYTLPNRWVDTLFRSPQGRIAMVALSAYVPLSFATWRWRVPRFETLFVLWFARMGASWLVEPRYTIPFVVLVLLAREEEPRWLEASYVPAYAGLTAYWVNGMYQDDWFPL